MIGIFYLEGVESGSEAGSTERDWREEPEEVYERSEGLREETDSAFGDNSGLEKS